MVAAIETASTVEPRHGRSRGAWLALAALLLVAAGQRAWNAYTVPPLTGYDGPGHAGYILTIVRDHRLPDPLEGWSTFHPPLYYLVAGAVWWVLEPLGPRAVMAGLRGVGAAAGLAVGLITYLLVARLGAGPAVAWIAAALALFVPCAQLAASMIGNDAFVAGLASLALPPLLTLQAGRQSWRAALLAGLFTGLALTAKLTGLMVAGAFVVPFLRTDLDRRRFRLGLACAAVVALLAGPIYLRNLQLTGSVIPNVGTRAVSPMRAAEAQMVLRQRRLLDYLVVPLDCLLRPSIFHVRGAPGSLRNRNPAMTSVGGLAYASVWYDPFAHRIPLSHHRDGVPTGPGLALLGLAPTGLVALGFLAAVVDLGRTRGRSPDAPLVVMAFIGVAMLGAFTWSSPTLAAVKGAYLLPLVPAAGVFFARGIALCGLRPRRVLLALSTAAALTAAVVFTNGLVFAARAMDPGGTKAWLAWAKELPGSRIDEAIAWLVLTR